MAKRVWYFRSSAMAAVCVCVWRFGLVGVRGETTIRFISHIYPKQKKRTGPGEVAADIGHRAPHLAGLPEAVVRSVGPEDEEEALSCR